MARRGEVVLVRIPYLEGSGAKLRPVVVVQGDASNARSLDTIVAAISTNLRHAGDPTQHVLDPAGPEGKAAGILQRSAIRCDRLFTIEQSSIARRIGLLTPGTLALVDDCLRSSLGLSPPGVP